MSCKYNNSSTDLIQLLHYCTKTSSLNDSLFNLKWQIF